VEQWCNDPAADRGPALSERLWRYAGVPARLVRSLAAVVLRGWLRGYHRLTIVGRQNLPLHRSFVLIANHASHLDTLCLLAALPLRRLHRAFPLAAEDYFCVSTVRALCAKVVANALPFDRHFAPWRSLSVCARLLEEPGTVLILYPEGTRRGGFEPDEFKPGVALLAAGRDVPVVPCHLAGTHAALPKGAWCPRPRALRLTIGAPRVYRHLPPTREAAEQICQELREAVISLGRDDRPETKPGGRVRRKKVLESALSPRRGPNDL
jgi:1-acyl-sn-glycerol-3-phosphate acyltransferase